MIQPQKNLIKSKIVEVAEEIRSCRIEANFSVRWEVIKMHHFIGKLLMDNFGENLAPILPTLAKKCDWSGRSLYRAAQFYRRFPDLDKIPNGKAASFNRLTQEYLIESGDKEPCKHENRLNIQVCGDCHIRL